MSTINDIKSTESLRVIRDEKALIIINFCKHIKSLIYLATNILPEYPELQIIKRGVNRITSLIGDVLIEEIGPELWLYNKEIRYGDFSFIKDVDFNKQIDTRKKLIPGKSNVDKYKSIINTVLISYNHCSNEVKADIHTIVKKLLEEYLKYLIHCKSYPNI